MKSGIVAAVIGISGIAFCCPTAAGQLKIKDVESQQIVDCLSAFKAAVPTAQRKDYNRFVANLAAKTVSKAEAEWSLRYSRDAARDFGQTLINQGNVEELKILPRPVSRYLAVCIIGGAKI